MVQVSEDQDIYFHFFCEVTLGSHISYNKISFMYHSDFNPFDFEFKPFWKKPFELGRVIISENSFQFTAYIKGFIGFNRTEISYMDDQVAFLKESLKLRRDFSCFQMSIGKYNKLHGKSPSYIIKTHLCTTPILTPSTSNLSLSGRSLLSSEESSFPKTAFSLPPILKAL